jgi:sec-independent protein translocase protein TatA
MTPVPAFLDGIGFSEMLVIGFLAILVFGGNLPDALKNLGRAYAKFRKGLSDVSRPLRDEIQRATTLPPEPYVPALPATTTPAPPPEPPEPYGAGSTGSAPLGPTGPTGSTMGGSPAFPAASMAGGAGSALSGAPDPSDDEPPPV